MRERQKRGGNGRKETLAPLGQVKEGFAGILAFELVFEGWSVVGRLLGS